MAEKQYSNQQEKDTRISTFVKRVRGIHTTKLFFLFQLESSRDVVDRRYEDYERPKNNEEYLPWEYPEANF